MAARRPGGAWKTKSGRSVLQVSLLFPLLSRTRGPLSGAFLVPAMVSVVAAVILLTWFGNVPVFLGTVAAWLTVIVVAALNELCGRPRPALLLTAAAGVTVVAILPYVLHARWLVTMGELVETSPSPWLAAAYLVASPAFWDVTHAPTRDLVWFGVLFGSGVFLATRLAGWRQFAVLAFLLPFSWVATTLVCIRLVLGPWAEQLALSTTFLGQFAWGIFSAGLPEELYKAVPVALLAWPGLRLPSPWKERLAVRGPMDGIVLGVASGAGFSFVETLGVYTPAAFETMGNAARAALGRDVAPEVVEMAGEAVGSLGAVWTVLARMIGGAGGHMAYSGYLGFFIGMAVLAPHRAPRLLLTGGLTAISLHAFWNASAGRPAVLVVAGITAYVFLASAILKARQYHPAVEPAPPHGPAVAEFSPPVVLEAAALTPETPGVEPPSTLVIRIGAMVVPVSLGATIAADAAPGLLAADGSGRVAEVVENPGRPGVLGLQNHSTSSWQAVSPDGRVRQIEPGRSIRLDEGVRLQLGAAAAHVSRHEP